MRARSSSFVPTTATPPTMSEWPLRYLVAECMTICAPNAIGCVSRGVATVESTATIAPTSRAIALAAAMSVMSQVGFAGVSIQMRLGRWLRARVERSSIDAFS